MSESSEGQGMKSMQNVREDIDERETVAQESGLVETLPSTREPEKIFSIDSEYLSGKRYP